MPHPRKLLYSLLITLVVSLPFYHLASLFNIQLPTSHFQLPLFRPTVLSDKTRKTLPPQAKSVDVRARVGGYMIDILSGWTSPFAEVNLSSANLLRKTMADKDGFFAFYFIPAPEDLGEICLIAQDVNLLPSFPVCLAPPPSNRNVQIENVLLSPTIFLEKGKIPLWKTTKASGMTFPNSAVQVYLFSERNFSFWASLSRRLPFFHLLTSPFSPSIVWAVGFPIYEIKSNQNGYFEFSLPAIFPSQNRVFVASVFSSYNLRNLSFLGENHSSKSNTLAFEVLGLWGLLKLFLMNFFRQAFDFFRTFKGSSWLILLEILALLTLLILIARSEKPKQGSGKTS